MCEKCPTNRCARCQDAQNAYVNAVPGTAREALGKMTAEWARHKRGEHGGA